MHRLRAGWREILNGEATLREHRAARPMRPETHIIRPAMKERRIDVTDVFLVLTLKSARTEKP